MTYTPTISVVKKDAAGNDANTAADAVDLTSAGGITGLNFTITNTGTEPLIDVVVTDAVTAGSGTVKDLTCTFPDGSKGTTWAGPFAPSESFPCTATLSDVKPGTSHTDVVTVAGKGQFSGTSVTATDPYNSSVKAAVVPPTKKPTPKPTMAATGAGGTIAGLAGAGVLLLAGAGALIASRRRSNSAE